MEIVQELFATAFVAIVFSFVVAKLVSISLDGDGKILERETVLEEVKFDKGLRVEGGKSKKRVHFVEEVVEMVDEFEGKGSVDKVELSRCGDVDGGIEVEERYGVVCQEVGSPEKSSEGGFGVEEIVGGFGNGGVKGRSMESGLEGLVVEERSESTSKTHDEFGVVDEENVVIQRNGNEEVDDEIGVESTSDDAVVDQGEEARVVEGGENEVIGFEGQLSKLGEDKVGIEETLNKGNEEKVGIEREWTKRDEEKEGLVSDVDDDWEGIERSELEKVFAAAANYVCCGGEDDRLSNVGSDVQMQLYGLHKVAMEGPCHEPQPMALMLSARAKWNAWQRLGNMSPEVAMEQYINLLSDKVPGWMEGYSLGHGKTDSLDTEMPSGPDPSISTFLDTQQKTEKERKCREVELKFSTDEGALSGRSNSINKDEDVKR